MKFRLNHRGASGRSLAALLVTVVALGSVWAVVWYNVPRDLSRSTVPTPPPEEFSDVIPPAPLKPRGERASVQPVPMLVPESQVRESVHGPDTMENRTLVDPARSETGSQIEMALNCREEAQKLCGEMEPGSGRFRDCLQQHRELMPAACQRNWAEHAGTRAEGARTILATCQTDLQRWCPGIPYRGAPIIRCLREHAGQLSTACSEILIEERVL